MGKNDLRGKLVYVVGGSSGIGLAAAKLAAAEGANVVIFGRRQTVLDEAVEEIRASSPSCTAASQRVAGYTTDVAVREDIEAVLNAALREFGPPHVLINSAGRALPNCFEEITYQQFDETIKTNLYGIWNTCSVLVPHMKPRGGAIVNVASMAGFLGVFGYTDYAASKFAVVGFSETLRSELRQHNISVHVLCPPDTDTPGFVAENLTKPPETKAISANAKLMTPEQVASQMLAGVRKNTFVIVPGFDGKLTYFLKRYLPFVVDRAMDSSIKKGARPTSP